MVVVLVVFYDIGVIRRVRGGEARRMLGLEILYWLRTRRWRFVLVCGSGRVV